MKAFLLPAALCFALSQVGCSSDEPPPADSPETVLWKKIKRADGYRTYSHAPEFPTRAQSAKAPHDATIEIWAGTLSVFAAAYCAGNELTEWPNGTIIVKEAYPKDAAPSAAPTQIAAMQKTDGKWLFAEWDTTGKLLGSGKTCEDCHASGNDYVRAFRFPQDLKASSQIRYEDYCGKPK